jgi:ABC-type enterochelin transport system substrate-binding protein
MKKTTLLSFLTVAIMLGACNNNAKTDKAKEKQDSISADASADSLLQEALKADTLGHDTLKADTLKK